MSSVLHLALPSANGRVSSERPLGDVTLFTATVVLLLVGVLMVSSSSAAVSLDKFGTPHHFLARHLVHLAVGAVVLAGLWCLDYAQLDRSAVVHGLWAACVSLLVITLFQPEVAGVRRWIRFGAASVQPSELAKIALVLVLAFQLSRRSDRLGDTWKGLLPPLLLGGQLALLVALQPDFGTTALLACLLGLMLFVAGTPLRTLATLAIGLVGLLGLYLVQAPYRIARLQAFLDPSFEPLGANFQSRQALIAIGTGGVLGRTSDGLLGTGLGCSAQKLFFLPEPHTDFVFAVLGEELGFVGTISVLALFLVILVRGFVVAGRAEDAFGTLLATGATAVIAIQALVNIMVVVSLLPAKGIPLPFLSVGGSSLVVSCAAAGLILSVSRHG